MSFRTFNREWIEEMRAQREHILACGALEKVQAFLDAHQVTKMPTLPIPLSIDLDTFERLAAAGRLLMAAQAKILRHLCQAYSRAEVLRMFNIPEAMVPFIDWDELFAGNYPISRFDIVLSNDGYYFCELNRDSSVGGIEFADCLEVFCEAMGWPLTEEGWDPPQRSTARLLARVAAEKGLRRLVLCDWSTNRGNGFFGFGPLHERLVRELPELEVHLVYENEYPDAWLAPDEARQTLFYRGFMYQDMTDDGAFIRRLWQSGATIINTFETELWMNKGWFAMFWDPRYRGLLGKAEIEAIEQYVPRTMVLNQDNLEQALRDRAGLVFKHDYSYGGQGVLMGADHGADELRALIEAQGAERWSAQQAITSDGLEIPHDADFTSTRHDLVLGLYLIDDRASGVFVRASSSSKIVNVSLGVAGSTWAVPMTPEAQARHLAYIRSGNTKP